MLQVMRSSAKFVFWILAVAFIGGFLLVESSGLLGRGAVTTTTAVATVNGTDILYTDWQRRSSQLMQQEQQQAGHSLTQDEQRRIENQAFDELISDVLLQQEYRRRGISVSDAELRDYARFAPPRWVTTSPDLQTEGRFDMTKYQRLLASGQARQSGLLVALEQYYRSEVPKEKLAEQVTAGVYVTDLDLWRAWQDANDSAAVSFVVIRPTPTAADSNVSDADLRKFYDAHKSEFDRPGHGTVSVVYIPRVVSAADSAATRARITGLRNEIVGGAKFEDVAKRESADSASATNGGDLGKGARGRFVAEFEKAIDGLKPGELSAPVLTPFGYHLIRLDSRNGDTVATHHILLRIQPSDSSAAKVDREADQLAKLAAGSDQPSKFDEAAKTLGLTPFKVDVNEGEPAMHDGKYVPSVSAWAFNGARKGEISDLFDGEDGYYLARVESLTESAKSFDAAKSAVRGRVAIDRAVERAVPQASALSAAAKSSTLEAAAAARKLTVQKTGLVTRSEAASTFGSVGEALGAAFALPANTVSVPIRERDGVFVLRVDQRKPADRATFEVKKKDVRAQRQQQLRQQYLQAYFEDLRKSAKIDDRRKEISEQLRKQSAT
ncbi:MAG TPA: peptidyl-prolyl cis-trans isomerase [Gemmatimonadaceae bacterium]|nr:peptidyl-prolyl cis-trans isomerase [Gemmatimonadaceae bacterium]